MRSNFQLEIKLETILNEGDSGGNLQVDQEWRQLQRWGDEERCCQAVPRPVSSKGDQSRYWWISLQRHGEQNTCIYFLRQVVDNIAGCWQWPIFPSWLPDLSVQVCSTLFGYIIPIFFGIIFFNWLTLGTSANVSPRQTLPTSCWCPRKESTALCHTMTSTCLVRWPQFNWVHFQIPFDVLLRLLSFLLKSIFVAYMRKVATSPNSSSNSTDPLWRINHSFR